MKNFLSFALALLLLPVAARADLQFEQKKSPCAADHGQFCKNTRANTISYLECMKKHRSELAPECKEKIDHLESRLDGQKAAARKSREACRDDFFKLCQGVPLDESTRRDCLLRHKHQLSATCAATL